MKHTQGKWVLNQGSNGYSVTTMDSKVKIIEGCRNLIANLELWEEQLANAKRIVQCVNSHNELLEKLKIAVEWLYGQRDLSANELIVLLKQAIAKAEEDYEG